MRKLLCALAVVVVGCGSAPETATKTEAPKPAPAQPHAVRDHTSMLPPNNRIDVKIVPDHILDQPKLPGGTLGDYKAGGKRFQMFVIDTEESQAAAFLLLDVKSFIQNPEYISSFGGYFGSDGKQPVFIFSKLHYVAGVVGLPKNEADPIARVLASRLN